MADIVLTTANAKYVHTAFGLRYLMANLGCLAERTVLLEFDIHQEPLDIVRRILQEEPRIVGFGVYIWNLSLLTQVVRNLKAIAPEVFVILGGPEVSYAPYPEEITQAADWILCGEADEVFAEVCRALLQGDRPKEKFIHCPPADLDRIQMPYHQYTDQDIATRLVYVESSRGCPFGCEFCLSSLDDRVRWFPMDRFLFELGRLIDRGARRIKFVDRTFNLREDKALPILDFLLEHMVEGLDVHFELAPHFLPRSFRERFQRFPAGTLRVEVGIQTFNEEVNARIQRRQRRDQAVENLAFLCQQTSLHVHADLILGLPGETLESFAESFDALVALEPEEIQVGILKLLRGAPIVRHQKPFQMIFSAYPPYEILHTSTLDFETIMRIRCFARYWEMLYNSGHFRRTVRWIWEGRRSPFYAFLDFSDWLFAKTGQRHAFSLQAQAQVLMEYLEKQRQLDPVRWLPDLLADYSDGGRREIPPFLRRLARRYEVALPQFDRARAVLSRRRNNPG